MIPFSLVWIWKNERKIVKFHEVITQAKETIKENINIEEIQDEMDFKLVHMKGICHVDEKLNDEQLDYSVENCYRLNRVVEMFQTKEIQHQKENDKEKWTEYEYKDDWYSYPITSSNFYDAQYRNNNPSKAWPFQTKEQEAKQVNLGKFDLPQSFITQIGHKRILHESFADEEKALAKTAEKTKEPMESHGFKLFKAMDGYLYSSASDKNEGLGTAHHGSYRVRMNYAPCDQVSLCAQLINRDDKKIWTFRKWNPEKINVPVTQETDASNMTDSDCYCCYLCKVVDFCMDALAEEVVFQITESD